MISNNNKLPPYMYTPQIQDLKKKQESQVQLLKQKQKSDEAAKRLQEEIQFIKAQKVGSPFFTLLPSLLYPLSYFVFPTEFFL